MPVSGYLTIRTNEMGSDSDLKFNHSDHGDHNAVVSVCPVV